MTDEDLVREWMAQTATRDIARKFGLTVNQVRSRTQRLREKGVSLPLRRMPVCRTDVDGLNAIIDRSGGKS